MTKSFGCLTAFVAHAQVADAHLRSFDVGITVDSVGKCIATAALRQPWTVECMAYLPKSEFVTHANAWKIRIMLFP